MKVLAINSFDYGSTGKIMLQIASYGREHNLIYYTFSKKWKKQKKQSSFHKYFGYFIENAVCFLFGKKIVENPFSSYWGTRQLIRYISRIKPECIHLHNLHGNFVNLPVLFHYIKSLHIPVIWTLHDCWTFTGRCPHFVLTKCLRWKTGCHDCPYSRKLYPQSYIDFTRMMWKFKRKWFTGIENCTIVTPSQWLADLVKQSFLKDYLVKVINNGIDLSVFKPTKSNFREKYGLVDKKVVLGVAFGWGVRKGLDVFIDLAKRLPKDYRIVLVGSDDYVDKQLPANIISIHRTQNQNQLAEIYTEADVFANPTREENYPTVNMESIACGTPVVTFRTGGSPEILDETCGSVVDCNDIDAMENEIRRICEEKPYSLDDCLNRAKVFDMNNRFAEYVKLYNEVMK